MPVRRKVPVTVPCGGVGGDVDFGELVAFFRVWPDEAEAAAGLAEGAGDRAMRADGTDGVPFADLEPADADQLAQRRAEGRIMIASRANLACQRLGLEGLVVRVSNLGKNLRLQIGHGKKNHR